jgi:hypothetical protein
MCSKSNRQAEYVMICTIYDSIMRYNQQDKTILLNQRHCHCKKFDTLVHMRRLAMSQYSFSGMQCFLVFGNTQYI